MHALLQSLALVLVQTPQEPVPEASATRIELRISPIVDLHHHVRASLTGDGADASTLAPALEACRALDAALGGNPLMWGLVEGHLVDCESADDFLRALDERMPASFTLRGRTLELREPALRLAEALGQVEPAFMERWEERRAVVEAARERWTTAVGPKEAELIAFHLASLGMSDRGVVVPVYLTVDGPWPGAVTHRYEADRGVSFVAVEGAPGSELFETILHEATHALDVASGDESAFGALRVRMEAAGIDPRDRTRDLPHALLFVQSAESIRRVVTPEHVDYGVGEGVYERLGQTAEAVRGFWVEHLDGGLGRDEALAGMVEALAPTGERPEPSGEARDRK